MSLPYGEIHRRLCYGMTELPHIPWPSLMNEFKYYLVQISLILNKTKYKEHNWKMCTLPTETRPPNLREFIILTAPIKQQIWKCSFRIFTAALAAATDNLPRHCLHEQFASKTK
jgi:hypothetical protein